MLLVWFVPQSRKDVEVIPFDPLSSGPAESVSSGVRYSSFVNGVEYVFVISSCDLPESNDYNIIKQSALTVPEAVVLARDSLGQYIPADDLPEWQIENVSLHHCSGLKWYYTVDFRPKTGGVNSDGSVWQLRIPVLMNGNVVSGSARQSGRIRKKNLGVAAQPLGVTIEDLILNRQESSTELQRCHDVKVISHVDKKTFKFEISSEALSGLENCDIEQPLPLTMHDAAATALKVSRLYIPAGQWSKWPIKEVSLNRWGNSDKWYYQVAFRLKGGVNGGIIPQLVIPVLLNGEAIRGELLSARVKAQS